MYILLSGYLPFNGENSAEVFDKILTGEYSLTQKLWGRVSDEAKELISKMLEIDTRKRFTAEQCLKHDWFKFSKSRQVKSRPSDDKNYLSNLLISKEFSNTKKNRVSKFVKKVSMTSLNANNSLSKETHPLHPKFKTSGNKLDYLDLLAVNETSNSRTGHNFALNEEHNLTREASVEKFKKINFESMLPKVNQTASLMVVGKN
mmetsp:Transcript_19379/g.17187  ORF Transcript_19379/g.17187 Transcript_19379/m.17187 type:complete len:203 (+) Transcript_19379:337-945(+)